MVFTFLISAPGWSGYMNFFLFCDSLLVQTLTQKVQLILVRILAVKLVAKHLSEIGQLAASDLDIS